MELECDHTGTGISVYNRSDETKKKTGDLLFRISLGKLGINS